MNKKGFTLIEIIVVITLIAFIGTISFFGIRLVNKNIKTTKLEQIEDKIFNAVSIYVETNEEVKNNLYTNKNGVYVPLNVLQNEGLIDFQDIKITDKDYVITMLGSENNDGACVDTTSIGSWNDGNKTIYLCTTSSGTTNIQTIGGQADNISKIERERKYILASRKNYIKYNNNPYMIYYIDTDDSLVLVSESGFGTVFENLTMNIAYDTYANDTTKICNNSNTFYCKITTQDPILNSSTEAQLIDCHDIHNMYKLTNSENNWLKNLTNIKYITYGDGKNKCIYNSSPKGYKIHLKPCMKIGKGTGYLENPYELINECTKNN